MESPDIYVGHWPIRVSWLVLVTIIYQISIFYLSPVRNTLAKYYETTLCHLLIWLTPLLLLAYLLNGWFQSNNRKFLCHGRISKYPNCMKKKSQYQLQFSETFRGHLIIIRYNSWVAVPVSISERIDLDMASNLKMSVSSVPVAFF